MKKRHTMQSAINIFLSAVALSAIIAVGSLYAGADSNSPQEALPAAETSNETTYILREYEGKLAMFRDYSDMPGRVYDFDVSLLTDYDRELLKQGIALPSERELERLLEDLTS